MIYLPYSLFPVIIFLILTQGFLLILENEEG